LKSAVTASPVALSALISTRGTEIFASSVSLSSMPVAAPSTFEKAKDFAARSTR
jgi:hypothetical protein